jgi:hypothetical protein
VRTIPAVRTGWPTKLVFRPLVRVSTPRVDVAGAAREGEESAPSVAVALAVAAEAIGPDAAHAGRDVDAGVSGAKSWLP